MVQLEVMQRMDWASSQNESAIIKKELAYRRIVVQEGNDILHWGYRPSSNFNLSEAYNLLMRNNNEYDQDKWHNI